MSHANIKERVHTVASRGIVPVILGMIIRSPGRRRRRSPMHGYGQRGHRALDAHADTADIIDGNLASHGTPMQPSSSRCSSGNPFRAGRPAWLLATAGHFRMDAGTGRDLAHHAGDLGPRVQGGDEPRGGRGLAKAEKLYVSVDVDADGSAHAPGTGTPEPGGITSADLSGWSASYCNEHDVVGVDVVEVAPAYDHAELTVTAAHRVVFEAWRAWRVSAA